MAPSNDDSPPDVASHDTADEQETEARESRESGGDAPSAGSMEEREAVAGDDDDLFGGDAG